MGFWSAARKALQAYTPSTRTLVLMALTIVFVSPVTITILMTFGDSTGPAVSNADTPFGYTVSLLIYLIPILAMYVRFQSLPGVTFQRPAFWWTLGLLIPLGFLLDLVFGVDLLRFPNSNANLGINLPGWSFELSRVVWAYLPIEEFLFYILGFVAILLSYVWCDEYWLAEYNRVDYRVPANWPKRLLFDRFELWKWLILLGVIAAAFIWKKFFAPEPYRDGWPGYFTFLICASVVPSLACLQAAKRFVNWQAFSLTYSWVLMTSLLWEATLALPYGWWGYKPKFMLGIFISPWSDLPIEAVLLWFSASYTTVLVYEIIKIRSNMNVRLSCALFGEGKLAKWLDGVADAVSRAAARVVQLVWPLFSLLVVAAGKSDRLLRRLFGDRLIEWCYELAWKWGHTILGWLGSLRRRRPTAVSLPADDGVRGDLIQWWYWTGHLQDAHGSRFGFQLVFFAIGMGDDYFGPVVRRRMEGSGVGIDRRFIVPPVQRVQVGSLSPLEMDGFKVVHCGLTDIGSNVFRSQALYDLGMPPATPGGFDLVADHPVRVSAVGGDGKDTLHVEFGGAAAQAPSVLDLTLTNDNGSHPPVLHYDGQRHDYTFGGYTFYYSRERMTAEGHLTMNGRRLEVSGTAWFDRQWGNLFPVMKQGWQWFALTLDDGTRIMVFDITGAEVERYGYIGDNAGSRRVKHDEIEIDVLGHWRSQKTNIRYPSKWRLAMGGREYFLEPFLADQEIEESEPEYWEGACSVKGSVSGPEIGAAYTELAGFKP